MIPDKIYIKPSAFNVPWPLSIDENANYGGIEYIRKDALFDYFHQRVEELNSPLNGVFGSTEREHCNERISELFLLIDKLNSM